MEKDDAFEAACLLRAARSGTLATQHQGQPFASLVTPATAPDGTVLLLLSSLSAHTAHLRAEPRCALLVTGQPEGANPQTAPRLTVTGHAEPEPDPAWRAYWLARHPYASLYAGFTDFALWRLRPSEGHYVAGFARAGRLAGTALLPAATAVAALAASTDRIMAHYNDDHADALRLLVAASGVMPADPVRMIGVDADGFDAIAGDAVFRVPFDTRVADAAGVRAALVRLVSAAREGVRGQ